MCLCGVVLGFCFWKLLCFIVNGVYVVFLLGLCGDGMFVVCVSIVFCVGCFVDRGEGILIRKVCWN